jgi:hypothetical protein
MTQIDELSAAYVLVAKTVDVLPLPALSIDLVTEMTDNLARLVLVAKWTPLVVVLGEPLSHFPWTLLFSAVMMKWSSR